MPANRDIRVEAVTEAVEAKASDSEAAVIDEHVRRPLIGLTPEQLSEVAVSVGLPRFAGKQMARWLYVGRATSVDEMTDLSKQGRIRLAQAGYVVGREEPLASTASRDGTVKYLFAVVADAMSSRCTSPRKTAAPPCACPRRPDARCIALFV